MSRIQLSCALIAFASLAGYAHGEQPVADAAASGSAVAAGAVSAHVVLKPTTGNAASGELSLVDEDGGVRITGRITGLKPGTEHGFHIHETGDCSAPDATSAGGHFNPSNQPHGHAGPGPHHAGDIPNQRADASGVASVDVLVDGIQVGGGAATDVIGRAVIVHAQPDDYKSQPSGNAGARIACGVIASGAG